MECCTTGELTRNSVRDACSRAICVATETSLNGDIFGVVVDALPTLGKSRTMATIAADLSGLSEKELSVTVLIHRKETLNQLEQWAEEAGLDPHQLPRFDDDCLTAKSDFGETWTDRIHDLRERGISPGQLHANPKYTLPCVEDRTWSLGSGMGRLPRPQCSRWPPDAHLRS